MIALCYDGAMENVEVILGAEQQTLYYLRDGQSYGGEGVGYFLRQFTLASSVSGHSIATLNVDVDLFCLSMRTLNVAVILTVDLEALRA